MEQLEIYLYATPHCEKCGSLPESVIIDGPSIKAIWYDDSGDMRFNFFKPHIWRTLCKYHRMEEESKNGNIQLPRRI